MEPHDTERLNRRELEAFFDRLFPNGFAGLDVAGEIAPEGWEQSPLVACFHPSAERVFEEELRIHRNIESLFHVRKHRGDAKTHTPLAEPTLEDVCREYQPRPVRAEEELTELVASCLWDVFSDNHDVIVADGRAADIGSFRGASAFLDEYLSRDRRAPWCGGDHMRFYMGTVWISGRADLTPVYAMIFRRLQLLGAEWVYHFPEIGRVDRSGLHTQSEQPTAYSRSEAAAAELKAQKQHAELERLRADLVASNAQAREAAMDQPPPAKVRAYRQVYCRDPRGWPPA
jgi:hypothetical protein